MSESADQIQYLHDQLALAFSQIQELQFAVAELKNETVLYQFSHRDKGKLVIKTIKDHFQISTEQLVGKGESPVGRNRLSSMLTTPTAVQQARFWFVALLIQFMGEKWNPAYRDGYSWLTRRRWLTIETDLMEIYQQDDHPQRPVLRLLFIDLIKEGLAQQTDVSAARQELDHLK